ncbi:MAG: LPS-assembly protein LptD [Victivallales bacterium]|nr:LPS-assembly protein LptD [Victivallales bacterium]
MSSGMVKILSPAVFAAMLCAGNIHAQGPIRPTKSTTISAGATSPHSYLSQETDNKSSEGHYFKGARDVSAHADSLDFVGGNVIATGNVVIKYKDIVIKADKAIVNPQGKDLDAQGNIILERQRFIVQAFMLEEYQKQLAVADRRLELIGYRMTTTGEQLLVARVYLRGDVFKAERISGNLETGTLEFDKFFAGYKNFFCSGVSASRSPEGTITVKNATVTTCEYIENHQEHYSIGCGTLVIKPAANPDDLKMYNPDMGEHSYWAYNCTLNVSGIPVMWLPMVYKPADVSPGLFQFQAGYDSDWGAYVQTSKKYRLMDYPLVEDRIYLDYYSKRGVGLGNELWIDTKDSKTNFFAYFIHDRDKWAADSRDDEDYNKNAYRLSKPTQRYDIKLSNLTHITPNLDFRGNLEILSDYYFLDDFFSSRSNDTPQPASYASLEYQHEYFSAAAYARPRVNNFYTAVQKFPEFSLDVPRQELFANIYYQSSTSVANMNMMFRDWDSPRTTGNGVDPKNYGAIRFDTLHMFYYPVTLFDWLNITPRAGGRFTYYNNSSKRKLSGGDVSNLFLADDPDLPNDGVNVVNYDDRGGAIARLAGEIGIQADTKIHRSWQNVKNSYWKLDGLRHVAQPYINYTYIPEPTASPDRIFYFDDIDRISRQNFIRFGLKNRLQTRRGDFGSEQIYEWASMENYVDYHFNREDDLSHLGDFTTILRFNPSPKLSLSSTLLLDLSGNKSSLVDTYRNGRYTDRAGISTKWIDKWQTTLRYEIYEQAYVYLSYSYQDRYSTHSAYSMGSMMTSVDAGTSFGRSYDRSQTVRAGIEVPVPVIPEMRMAYEIYYDVEAGLMREQQLRLSKTFHCWKLAVIGVCDTSRGGSDSKKEAKFSVMATMSLTAMPGMQMGSQTNFESDRSRSGGS